MIDRIPPYDASAEAAVLGAILLDNARSVEVAAALSPGDFYLEAHRRIYETMVELADRGSAIDAVVLGSALRDAGHLEKIGGAVVIAGLTDACAVPSQAETYARIVHEKAVARRVIYSAQEIVAEGYSIRSEDELMEWLGSVRERIALASEVRGLSEGPKKIDQDLVQAYEEIASGKLPEGVVKTGISTLDDMIGGLWPGLMTVLAARPGMGKTAIGINIAINAVLAGRKVLYLTLEDTRMNLVLRLLARFSNVDLLNLIHRRVRPEDYGGIIKGINALSGINLWVDDTAGMDTTKIRAMVAAHKLRYGLDLLVVDHLHEINEKADDPTESVSIAATRTRDLAKDLNIPALLLAQLNREVEKRTDKRPIMSDLRQAGKIEEAARSILFLYRAGAYRNDPDSRELEIVVAKQTHGRTGMARAWVDLPHMYVRGWDATTDGSFGENKDEGGTWKPYNE